MSAALLDLNLLIALAWPSHIHHRVAHGWFTRRSRNGWATCPFTQTGFVRISSNPSIIHEAVTPLEALDVLRRICALKYHRFWDANIDLSRTPLVATSLLIGHRQVTDAYLIEIAIRKGGKLATLDQSLTALLPSGSPYAEAIEVIPVTDDRE